MPLARLCLAIALATCTLGAARGESPEPVAPAFVPFAHSALLAVDAAAVAGGLLLRVRRAGGESPPVVQDVAVTIDGVTTAATLRPDGGWFCALPSGSPQAGKTIAVTVGHDGIREVLDGRLPGPAAASRPSSPGATSGMSSSRKQLLWWVLNIAVVLIAAIAISRRTS
ncbi:MAG TPA: hypothetical protein VMT66_12695 [Steroidobacteraceae bacterium]|nr:hypothetical protein [Steroidobacteraceae bacterium]